jgi:hypothetical protein
MKESSIFKEIKLINSKTDGLNCLINTKQTSRCSHHKLFPKKIKINNNSISMADDEERVTMGIT